MANNDMRRARRYIERTIHRIETDPYAVVSNALYISHRHSRSGNIKASELLLSVGDPTIIVDTETRSVKVSCGKADKSHRYPIESPVGDIAAMLDAAMVE